MVHINGERPVPFHSVALWAQLCFVTGLFSLWLSPLGILSGGLLLSAAATLLAGLMLLLFRRRNASRVIAVGLSITSMAAFSRAALVLLAWELPSSQQVVAANMWLTIGVWSLIRTRTAAVRGVCAAGKGPNGTAIR